ncbi:MAG: hypothetical protein ABJM06_08025 [Gilvibacter sp.]
MSTVGPFLKKNAPWIVAALLLVIIMVGSGFGYKYHQEQLKPLDSLKTELVKRDQEEALKIERILDSVSSLDYEYNSYYEDYVREYNRRVRLEREMRSIISMRFNRAYLDSIADHYKYR